MKELSIEEKAVLYDEALLNMKRMVESGIIEECYAKGIFSEFEEESEDEKIRKTIIEHFEGSHSSMYPYKGFTKKQILAWLEKQGAKVSAIEGFETEFERQVSCLIASSINKDYEYTKAFVKWASQGLLNYAKHEIEKQGNMGISEATKKKLEDNLNKALEKETPESCNEFLDEQGEPKFKAEDWVVYEENIYQIHNISLKKYYECLRTDGTVHTFDFEYIDSKSRLWTIQDAKDGDVLVSPSTPEGDKECPFIFKEIDKNGVVRFHAALLQNKDFEISNDVSNVIGYANAGYHVPATKEQRDFLFKKMKEAGYEWNAEKKELKNIDEGYNGEDYGIDGLYTAIDILQKTLGEVDGYQSDDGILEHKCAISAVKNLYDQNPIWSEDDERLFQIVIDILDRQNQLRNISLTDLIACVKNSNLSDLRSGKTY